MSVDGPPSISSSSLLVLALGLTSSVAGCQQAAPATTVANTASAPAAATPAAGSAATAAPRPPPGSVGNLDARAFAEGVKRPGVVVLDVRTPGEVARAHLAGASVIDIGDDRFVDKVGLMARDRPVYVYCASGARSAAASRQLAKMGFAEVYNLSGGIHAWMAEKLPVERGATGAASGEGVSPAAFDALLAQHSTALVSFETPWCAPCQRMKPRVDALATSLGLHVVHIDIDASEELARRERVVGVPVLALREDGKETWRHAGELEEAALAAELPVKAKPN